MSYKLFEHDRVIKFFKKHKKDKELLLRIHKKYLKILENPYDSSFKELKPIKEKLVDDFILSSDTESFNK